LAFGRERLNEKQLKVQGGCKQRENCQPEELSWNQKMFTRNLDVLQFIWESFIKKNNLCQPTEKIEHHQTTKRRKYIKAKTHLALSTPIKEDGSSVNMSGQ
jgi:hypothetical protein